MAAVKKRTEVTGYDLSLDRREAEAIFAVLRYVRLGYGSGPNEVFRILNELEVAGVGNGSFSTSFVDGPDGTTIELRDEASNGKRL